MSRSGAIVASSPRGVRGTGMVPAFSNNTSYPLNNTAALQTNGGSFLRSRHQAAFDVAAIRLVYGNFIDTGNLVPVEVAGTNPILVRASFEYAPAVEGSPALPINTNSRVFNDGNPTAWSSVTNYPVGNQVTSGGSSWVSVAAPNTNQTPALGSPYWVPAQYCLAHFQGENATRDVTIQPGQVVVSEPIPLNPYIPKGQYVYVNTLCQPNNGTANTGSYPGVYSVKNSAAGEWGVNAVTGAAPPDYTATAPVTTTTFPTAYGPIGIIAYPKSGQVPPVIFLFGDSIAAGSLDTAWGGGNDVGWMIRMLSDNPASPTQILYPHYRAAKGGGKAIVQFGAGLTNRLMLASGCTHVVDAFATNDIAAGVSLATLQASALARWNAFVQLGLKVIGTTCPPQSTSTDTWATVANQTPVGNFGAGSPWANYNTWIRTVPAPLSAIIDVASVLTNTTSGGANAVGTVWQPGMTTSSPHPSQAGHIAMAQLVNATALFGAAP